MSAEPFADRLVEAARGAGAPLCVGLDPFADKIPALFGDAKSDLAAVEAFFEEILGLCVGVAACVKPQLGLFEAYGAEGYALAQRLTASARARGLLVILDAKRGDIGTTAEGYAQAAYAAFGADCVTVNPYMGLDTLAPFVAAAQANAGGVAVLVRTSNPGAKDFQDLDCAGAPLWARVAEALTPLAAGLTGASGWSGLMAVAGATYPEEAKRLRALMPNSLFLVPGFGAQGASAADALAGFVRGPAGLEGGVVSASRAALYPPGAQAAINLPAWRETVASSFKTLAQELKQEAQ